MQPTVFQAIPPPAPKHVYTAINEVQAIMAKEGLGKNRRNEQGAGYNFRGVDDVMNALAGHLAKAKLMILPRAVERIQVERTSKNGGALFYTTIKMEFDFVSAVDGSVHTVAMYGEAMDSGDKSSNKSAAAAFKYACFQAFCIPVEGDNDADATTHEVAPKAVSSPVKTIYKPEGPMATPDTLKALETLCFDSAQKARLENVLTDKGLVAFSDLSEKDASSLLKWANTPAKK